MLNAPVGGTRIERSADLQVGGLHLWIDGRQFPDDQDYWDGNWLMVTAECRYPSSNVRASGPIIHLPELAGLLNGCLAMHETLGGQAALNCMEPNLSIAMEFTDSAGHIRLTIGITPDNVSEEHKYHEEIDQTFLPRMIDSCKEILRQYPVRGGSPK